MISNPKVWWRPDDDGVTREALDFVNRSGVCVNLRKATARARGAGGRPAGAEVLYTLEAVLVAMYLLIRKATVPSIRAVFHCLLREMTADQRQTLGMTPEPPPFATYDERKREYHRFHHWLTRSLLPMDSGFDLPAQRSTVAEDRRRIAARSPEDHLKSRRAERLTTLLINDLIAASIHEQCPEGYRGDVVADETIMDVSDRNRKAPDGEWYRSAVYSGAYYNQGDKGGLKPKRGHGLGVTAVIRAGSPDTMHKVAPVITGISVNRPSSGTPRFLEEALAQHRRNGFDARPTGKNAAHPYCVTDMGYTVKDDYAGILFRRQYAQISRFPKRHNVVHPLPGARGEETGVTQIAGDVFCPAAPTTRAVHSSVVIGTEGLDKPKADSHDHVLQQLFPFMMGRNSRLRLAGAPGRPPKDGPRQKRYRLEVVCPAVQGRVRCPLKPDSMTATIGPDGRPLLEAHPTWDASEKPACQKSSVVVELPKSAFKQFHASLPASAWEHTFLYESYRSMTERAFSTLKSEHVSPCRRLNWAPKREPYLLLVIAMSISIMNLAVQENWPNKSNPNMFRRNMADLEKMLGRPPMRVPPRT